MLGYAEFKSHVLKRDEKGLFGIPFKRLLGCGLGAGALLTVLRLAFPDVAFVSAAASFVVLLVLSDLTCAKATRKVDVTALSSALPSAATSPAGTVTV